MFLDIYDFTTLGGVVCFGCKIYLKRYIDCVTELGNAIDHDHRKKPGLSNNKT